MSDQPTVNIEDSDVWHDANSYYGDEMTSAARQRAETALRLAWARGNPVARYAEEATKALARDVVALADRVEAAEKQSRESSEMYVRCNAQCGELLSQQSFMARTMSALAARAVGAEKDAAEEKRAHEKLAALAEDQQRKVYDKWMAAEARVAELEKALEPFAEFGQHNTEAQSGQGWHWRSRIHYEAISTWFGPSDFGYAAALSPVSPNTEETP